MALDKEIATPARVDAPALPAAPPRALKAARDIAGGLGRYWLWGAMAMQDIRLRYRGSLFGPFWLTLSTMVMIGTMGVIYPHLFHTDVHSYLPFLALGIIVWQFIQTLIVDSCQTFLGAQDIIL